MIIRTDRSQTVLFLSFCDSETCLAVVIIRCGYRAEYTVSYTPRNNSDVIVRVRFQLASPVIFDGGGIVPAFCLGREIPVPLSVRIGGQPDIISVASVNLGPVKLHPCVR